jgi:hypothetical protein
MNVCDIVEFEDGMIKADRGYFAEPFETPEWRAHLVKSFKRRGYHHPGS